MTRFDLRLQIALPKWQSGLTNTLISWSPHRHTIRYLLPEKFLTADRRLYLKLVRPMGRTDSAHPKTGGLNCFSYWRRAVESMLPHEIVMTLRNFLCCRIAFTIKSIAIDTAQEATSHRPSPQSSQRPPSRDPNPEREAQVRVNGRKPKHTAILQANQFESGPKRHVMNNFSFHQPGAST